MIDQLMAPDVDLTDADRETIGRKVAKLDKMLTHWDDDTVWIRVALRQDQARNRAVHALISIGIPGATLVTEDTGDSPTEAVSFVPTAAISWRASATGHAASPITRPSTTPPLHALSVYLCIRKTTSLPKKMATQSAGDDCTKLMGGYTSQVQVTRHHPESLAMGCEDLL